MARRLSFLLIAAVLLLLSACTGEMVKVTVPPKAPVDGIQRILVLPFENFTTDPGVAREFELRVVDELRSSEWYDFVESERTRSLLAQYGYTLEDLKIETKWAQIAKDLRIDAIIVGEATYYLDDVYLGPVSCSNCQSQQRQWFVNQFTTVEVHVTARMIDLHTGRELHIVRTIGEDWNSVPLRIDWSGEANNPPPTSLIPSPNRQQITQTRSSAIQWAVRAFTQDIMPTFEWVPAK